MSLTDALLADLEDDSFSDGDIKTEYDETQIKQETMDCEDKFNPVLVKYDVITDVAKLSASEVFIELINKMNEMMESTEIPSIGTSLETDPQYQLVVKLSELASEIDTEISIIHKFVKDKYKKRFPELEKLIFNPLEYIACVKMLGNDIKTKGQNKDALGSVLQASNVIVVIVEASTSKGESLVGNELDVIYEACDMADYLKDCRSKMQTYIEKRMNLIAPNITAVLGSAATAMIISQAGSLNALVRMPACNVLVLGQQRKNLIGLSTASTQRNTGFIYYHPIVQSLPPEHRRKAAKIIAYKIALCAKIDFVHESRTGEEGLKFKEEIQKKIDKMLEPPPVKFIKSLPKPIDQASKKRGGRRVRKMKEAMGMSEMRKQTNRMGFGDIQEDIDQQHMGVSEGFNAKGASSGRIRAAVVDNKTRVKISQKLQKSLEAPRFSGHLSSVRTTAGTSSSISFTPFAGYEITSERPKEELKSEDQSGYFSTIGDFKFVKPSLPK
uniref:U4/U6 small nuclear ribonucleoprotein Prp31 n=1 Tax=Rhabditophanes sp. KR3021 TaxID=114890 RepID=A0AC35TMM3_9BILA